MRRILALIAFVWTCVFAAWLFGAVTMADASDGQSLNLLDLDTAALLALAVSVIIPLLSSLLYRLHWPVELLGIFTLLISTANGFLTTWADSADASHYDWKSALGLSLGSFAVAVLGRVALWKGTRIDQRALQLGSQ